LIDGQSASACTVQSGVYTAGVYTATYVLYLCAGMEACNERPEKSWGEAGTGGHILTYRKPSIINLLLGKLEHVVICRSQVLLVYASGIGFCMCREKLTGLEQEW